MAIRFPVMYCGLAKVVQRLEDEGFDGIVSVELEDTVIGERGKQNLKVCAAHANILHNMCVNPAFV